jgi:hypothetical protein
MQNEIQGTQPSKHCRKRSRAQREADLEAIESAVLKGSSHLQIAELLAQERPYRLSRQSITNDVAVLTARWVEASGKAFAAEKARALRVLSLIESEAWENFDRSKGEEGVGNPAFLRTILDASDRRTKLHGLDSPSRIEMSGPNAGPVAVEVAEVRALSETAKAELFKRHVARLAEADAVQPYATVDASN